MVSQVQCIGAGHTSIDKRCEDRKKCVSLGATLACPFLSPDFRLQKTPIITPEEIGSQPGDGFDSIVF
jgi:hypothetical protein